jgi:site-specific recombinase XerD
MHENRRRYFRKELWEAFVGDNTNKGAAAEFSILVIPKPSVMPNAGIEYRLVQHNGLARIQVKFPHNKEWNDRIRQVDGCRWSKTLGSWHIPDTKENRELCGISATGMASPAKPLPGKATSAPPKLNIEERIVSRVTEVNQVEWKRFTQMMQLKGYSASTMKTYRNEFGAFLQTLGKTCAADLTTDRVKDYLQYCHVTLQLSENTIHSRINALKFYYEQVLKREKFFWDIPRPKKPMLLPKLLNETELRKLFNALSNKKHKAMLFTAYSAGLRVSEIVNLKICDIDSQRMQIFVRRAKGKKDRYVNLSPVLLDILREYIKQYRPAPREYLFESEQTGTAYPPRTVQQMFTTAKRDAKISKQVGIHSLRHSFATHLLDKGTDIRYIKELLGHFNIRTTERYLHVSKKQLVNIVSPLDDLWKREQIDW